MNVYRIADHAIPDYLNVPIKRRAAIKIKQEPIAFINPVIDGCVTTFYEWTHAGLYTLDDILGAMQTGEKSIDAIYYGFNLDTLFFRIDINRNVSLNRLEGDMGCIELVTEGATYQLRFPFQRDTRLTLINAKSHEEILSFDGSISFDKIIELSCPFSSMGVRPCEDIQFAFMLIQDDIPEERWPKFGTITFTVPDEHFEDTVWNA